MNRSSKFFNHKNLFFHPDDPGETTPPTETKTEETKTEESGGPEFIIDGEVFKPTAEQQRKLMALGLESLKKSAVKEEPKKEPETKAPEEKTPSEQKALEEKIAKLEDRLEKKLSSDEHSLVLNAIDLHLDKSEIPEAFKEDVKLNFLTQYSLIKNKGESVNPSKLAKSIVDTQTKKYKEFLGSKVDVKKKIEDKDKTKYLSPGSSSAGDESKPTLSKKSFRDGTLTKSVLDMYKKALDRATE